MSKSYLVDIYLPSPPKYSGDFKFLSASDAAWNVVNNVTIVASGNDVSHVDVESAIRRMPSGGVLIFWCDHEAGRYARVEVKSNDN